MRWLLFLFAGMSLVCAQEGAVDELEVKGGEARDAGKEFEKYDVGLVIAKPIADLKPPRFWEGVGDVEMVVFAKNEEVQRHVNHGFALLHASWDFEAYRHFAAALKEDANCLMAYCGIVLALTNPEHEFKEERARALQRMISLAEEKGEKEGSFYFPDLERGYAYSIGILLTDGLVKGAEAFRKVARRYPKDMQLTLLAAFLSRGGYSEFGDVRPAQSSALRVVEGMLKAFPENTFVMNFLVMMKAEAPYQAVDFEEELLPYSKKLVELSDGKMPTFHALLGHMAWRCGELDLAQSSFERAIELYSAWKEENGIANADADGLVRAKIFLAAVHYAKEDLEKGLELLKEVSSLELAEGRELSAVALAQKWHANLLPFHLYLARGGKGDLERAKAALPKMIGKKDAGFDAYRMVLDGYTLYLRAVGQVQAGNYAQARQTHALMAKALNELKRRRVDVMKTRQFTDFSRHFTALFAHHLELAGMISGDNPLAFNWFKSAIDAQRPGTRLLPQPILYPMELRMAQYYLGKGMKKEAREYAELGLERMPYCPRSKEFLERLGE